MKINRITFYFIIIIFFFLNFIPAYTDSGISMDFEDVELKVLIKTMSEILEENFIISSKVEGRVSVSAPRNVSKKESLNMLKDILIVHGYVMIETPESFEITSAEDTKNLPGYFSSGKSIPEELLMSNSIITHVIPLEYTDAEEVKNLLTPLVSAGGYVGSNKETNMIVMTGDVKNIKNLLDIIKNVDQQHSSKGRNDLTVIKCNNISSLKVAEMLDKLYTSKLRMAGRTESAAYPAFIAHEESNSLLISANASETEKIVSALHTIDQQKKQVLVKAVIAEVTERTAKEIGFDILSTGGILYATEKGFAKIEDLGMNKALLGGADADNLAVSYAEGTNDFSGTIIPDISWVVKLSKKHDGIDIISTPKLLTVDNEEAEIIVGTNLAYLKDSQVTPQGGTVKTFDFKDVGLKLSIKPRISSNDMITLTLSQQLEEVLGLSFEGGVETSKRSISTTVILKDRSLAVIGGLTADNKNKSTQGVPFISKIPIIGNLFKKNSEKSEKRNLLLFITAQIVRTPQEMKDITDIESKGSNIKAEK